MKFLLDEKGSMIPLWAIGGTVVILSILWVDNVSWALFEKIKQMNVADALTRITMIEEGASSNNAAKIISAIGSTDPTASFHSDATIDYPPLIDIDERVSQGRLMSPFSDTVNSSKTVSVPFTSINKSIAQNESQTFNTLDRSMKLIKPINVFVAIENTDNNRSNFGMARQPLINALGRLYSQAPASRVSIIPYSFRVNQNGYCYTGISRGDYFSFSWWESYFANYNNAATKNQNLSDSIKNLQIVQAEIARNDKKIEKQREELKKYDPGTDDYINLNNEIKDRVRKNRDLAESIPQLQQKMEDAKDSSDRQNELVENLQNTTTYEQYRPLALHYAKNFGNYKLLEDYTDTFANSNGYSVDESSFLRSAIKVSGVSADYLRSLAVIRSGPFADADTCPSVNVTSNYTNLGAVASQFNRLTFNNDKVMTLEGLLWSIRLINDVTPAGSRNVILMFVSDKEDALDDNKLLGVGDSCNAIKQSYYDRRTTKIIFVVKNREAMDKFNQSNCATRLADGPGFIVQDDIDDNFSEQMELKFMYIFSQESTSRDAH